MYELFTSFISFVFKDLVLLAGIAAVMLVLNWRLALVTFIVLPLVAAASIRFSKRARDIFRTLRVQVAEINTRFAETIGGMRVIQLFRQEANNFRRFAGLNHENYLAGMRADPGARRVHAADRGAGADGSVALIVWYGGGLVLAESLSLGALVAFISYIRMFFRPLRDLAEKYNILQNAMASAERIFLVLDTHHRAAAARPPTGGVRSWTGHRGAALRAGDLRLSAGRARAEARSPSRSAPGGNRGGGGRRPAPARPRSSI